MSFSKALDFFVAEYPHLASHYLVITDNGVAGFSKISGITLCTNEFRSFNEGGIKGVHILAEQDKQFNTLTLEKGVGRTGILDALGPLKTFIIVSLSKSRLPEHAYSVSGAVLQKLMLSDFNAETASVLISSATVAYRKMASMPLMGLTSELMPVAKDVAGTLINGGITAGNGLIETFKSVNIEVDKQEAYKLLKKAEEKLDELIFWE